MTADFKSRSDATTLPATRPRRSAPRTPESARLEALPPGARLHEFELLRVIGSGGFGIVYLARDDQLLRQVAIKEYLPDDFAQRAEDGTVVPRTPADASTFAMGLRSFLREAQLLAGFDHPALVKVHRFWEANGTAYMAMPYYAGCTLKEMRKAMAAPPDERWLRGFIDPLLSALECLHDANVCHRDVSPDNILLSAPGRPVLLDFGSARHVVGERTQALTAVFKPSFAAIEQYGDVPGLRQGPWTDLYALGGVVHFLLMGAPPTPAAMRAVHDPQRPLQFAAAGMGIGLPFLRAVDWMLAVRPERRPPSVRALREVLDGAALPPGVVATSASNDASHAPDALDDQPPSTGEGRDERKHWLHRRARAGALAGLAALGIAAVVAAAGSLTPDSHPPSAEGASASAEPQAVSAPRATGDAATSAPAVTAAVAASAPRDAVTVPAAPASSAAPSLPRAAPAATESPAPRIASTDRPRVRAEQRHAAASPAAPKASADQGEGGPRQACADRSFISRAVCMERVCRDPAYRAHAECAAVRQYVEARLRRAEESR